MRVLTKNEIYRTSFPYMKQKDPHPLFTHTGTNVDSNMICPYCKNQDTDVVRNPADLQPFKEFYGDKQFKVINCFCCNAIFSFCVPS